MSTAGRILVVEDDPDAALFAVHVLANLGHFDVTHTADPAVALRLVATEPWDLVVTDVQLPGMSGLELLDALRHVAPALPVVVATATPGGSMRLNKADVYLEKPLRIASLLATATTLIDRGRTAR
ncbi:MAG: response regulator [Streptosporangiaceae bacterium]|jgi:CheY-like chemotaxis protein